MNMQSVKTLLIFVLILMICDLVLIGLAVINLPGGIFHFQGRLR